MSHRQQPGLACEECRRRKSKCDRERPQCGGCVELGLTCVFVDERPKRGPKKGQLSTLRHRIATLEQQLGKQVDSDSSRPGSAPVVPISPPMFDDIHQTMSIDVSTTICHEEVPAVTTLEQQLGKQVDSDPSGPNSAPVVPISPSMFNDIHQTMSIDVSTTTCHEKVPVTSEPAMSSLWTDEDLAYDSLEQFSSSPILFGTNLENISALVAADLDQIYFDRVHVFAPIIQKTRYFTWAYQENPSPERTCLRLAMRSLAAAVSTQLRNLADSLYAQTRQMLNALDSIRLKLEQVQAWILVSYFEALFHSRTQTLLTAGRAMRLVQVLRLHLGDTPEAQSPEKSLVDAPWMQEEMLMVAEERRRTYWVAYCLDRLLCLAPNMTLTLQEDMSYLRLPNSESNFENGQLNLMGFLPEIPTCGEHEPSPALAECIFMSTLYGRCMFHRCIALSDCMSGKVHYDFWKRQEELSQDVEKQMKLLQRAGAPSIMERRDPLLAFSLILGHSLVVYHCETAKLQTYQTVEQHIVTINCVTRAHQSAKSIVEWAREFGPSRCLKAHPFLSSAISIVVRFLISSSREPSEPTEDYKDDIQTLLSVLRSLSGIYRCASQLLDELESEEMFLGMSMDYTSLSAC